MATFLLPALKTTLCCLLVFTSLLDTTRAQQQPNIIFILTDDQRWNALGYSGNDLIKTPEMDKLAREGAYFKNALVTTPICAASRASILTGLYERTHKYTFQTGAIRNEYMESSYPKLLRQAGYLTGFFGKFGVNYPETETLFDKVEVYDRNNRSKDHRGYFYKTLHGDTVHLTRYTGQKALDFIDDANTDQPFCLSLSFSAPHAHDGAEAQYFWQEEQDPLYVDMQMPGPKLGADQYFEALPGPVRDGFNRTRWKWRYDTPEKYQHSVKGYYRMIKGIDNEIAAIRRKLKEKGLDQNTIIMLMGDNGYFLGERQLAGKWLMYDNSVRVPLIIYDPRISQHKDIETMALNIDVPSTILDMAGIASPDTWHGQSLVPLLSGQEGSIDREEVLIEHLWDFVHIPPSEGVRTPEWKYLRYVNDKSAEELYNLQDDPQEIKNLAGEARYAPVLKRLQASCDRLAVEFADPLSGVPHDLMVEYIRSPRHTGITDEHPELSWIVPKEAGIQKGYQILVSSSKQLATLNQGDVWDSGQIRGSQSVNVEMNAALQKHTEYFWKVRIWDKDNRLSEYSEIQTFQTTDLAGTLSSPNSFQVEHIKPTSIQQLPSGDYFVDFGKSAFGTIELDYSAANPEQLTIRLGEKLLNGKIDRNPGGTIRYTETKLSVTPEKKHYIIDLEPDERNTGPNAVQLPDSFGVILPFRYCEITNASEAITDQDIVQKAFFHYFEMDESSFNCSDETLNMIWDLCKYSMKATSFAGLYVDGDRERIPYEADAYINQLGHYSTDREYAMAKQTIEYFMQHPTWPTEWLLHTALMVYQDYYYSGDLELAAAYYDGLKVKTLYELANKDGLISSFHGVDGSYMAALGFKDTTLRLKDIVDWPPAQADTGWKLHTKEGERDGHEMLPINTVVNAFFYANMEIMAELAGLLEKRDDQQYFELMALKVKNAINNQLYDPEQGAYLDGVGASHASLHANMLPLAFGIVPEHRLAPVVKHIKSRGMACSVYGAQFLLEGLYLAGEAQYALDLMRAKNDRSWWNMIAIGSTVTLEAWDMKYKPNSDWNHAWGGAPANIIPRFLWGIQPKKPGYEVVTIKPQMADLTESEIKVPTIRGPIEGSYQRINDRLTQYHITLPANTVAEFVADISPQAVVSLNGKVVNLTFGSIRLDPGESNIEIKINSF